MCRRKSKAMNSVSAMCLSQNMNPDVLFQKAKLLLGAYRRVCWASLGTLEIVNDADFYICDDDIDAALEYLQSYAPDTDRHEFEKNLRMEQLPQNKIGWSIRLMLATGMRTQELLALEPRHIKEDGSRIVIEQALKRVKGSVDIGPPKSQDSFRTIPVPVSVRHCARFLAATDTMFIWEGKYKDKPCNPTHFADLYKKALTEIEGMRYLSPHCCRHTYVSQMQALGVDLATIQSIVGHADIDMTKHYLHVQESIRQAAIEKFSEAFMVEEEQMGNSSHLSLVKSS